MNENQHILESSFRDPSGFVFEENNIIYRQINKAYYGNYDHLMKSGLYAELTKKGLLIRHEETALEFQDKIHHKRIKPSQISFISYPYEWTFSQLKDVALATISIQKIAMRFGMSLKDASAFNVQFHKGRPLLIDTLSFEKLDKKKPWVAYRQFCQHFLAPLSLMSHRDVRLVHLFRSFIDGVPLDLASSLLPKSTLLSPSLLMHIHAHAKTQKKFASKEIQKKSYSMNKYAMGGLILSLEKGIKKLHWKKADTEWGNYYSFTNYSNSAFKEKKEIIEGFLEKMFPKPKRIWDLGGNTGLFSRIASDKKIDTLSFDIDYLAVEKNYRQMKKQKERNILPLFLDLTNPSPNLGWAHQERESLQKRGPVDCVFALALIHHISISNNVPFEKVSQYFSSLGKFLIIEFVPKNDSNVQRLLSTREDVFPCYDKVHFEKAFEEHFQILKKKDIKGSKRIIYLMQSLLK